MDFFHRFRELVFSKPRNAVSSRNVENTSFGDYIYRSKNAYLCYFGTELQDCYYCEYTHRSRDCVDCSYLHNCDLCYECTDGTDLYNCQFLQDCHHCTDCFYCVDLMNCQDCFGSTGLRNVRFAIFNKVYSEAEYRERLRKLMAMPSREILGKITPEFAKHPRLSSRLLKGEENCVGDYIYWSKNAYRCFNVRHVQDCAYLCDFEDMLAPTHDTYDADFCGGLEFSYDCFQTAFGNNNNFLLNCTFTSDSEYCINSYSCRNCFGCAYLQNKEYHILNKPFPRDEYLQAVDMIKKELKSAGTYGKSLAEILL